MRALGFVRGGLNCGGVELTRPKDELLPVRGKSTGRPFPALIEKMLPRGHLLRPRASKKSGVFLKFHARTPALTNGRERSETSRDQKYCQELPEND